MQAGIARKTPASQWQLRRPFRDSCQKTSRLGSWVSSPLAECGTPDKALALSPLYTVVVIKPSLTKPGTGIPLNQKESRRDCISQADP